MKAVSFQETKYEWSELHLYYQNIKKLYNLTSRDIITQLLKGNTSDGLMCGFIQYLAESGRTRSPSTKKGTCGATIRKILLSGIFPVIKTDWKPSTATYAQKLSEKRLDGYLEYHVDVIERDGKYTNPPELEVGVFASSLPTNKELEKLFTIDGIVPKIVEISQMFYLI